MVHVEGSGVCATPTVNPYQFSKTGFTQLIDVNVPLNWIVPLPSTPQTEPGVVQSVAGAMTIEDPPYSCDGPPLSIVNGSVALKRKEASIPPWPKLQMAIHGLVTAVAK